jgi:hypothetical protein
MNNDDLKAHLKSILLRHEGRPRAITGRELAAIVGHRDDRRVRLVIRDLITDGLPVVSNTESPGGYFIPTSIEEAKHCTESLRSRSIEIFLRRKQLIRNTALYLKPALQGKLL